MDRKGNPTRLFTLRAMSARLKVPASWLQSQAELGAVPAIFTGSGYLFSVEPTVEAIGRLASVPISQQDNRISRLLQQASSAGFFLSTGSEVLEGGKNG